MQALFRRSITSWFVLACVLMPQLSTTCESTYIIYQATLTRRRLLLPCGSSSCCSDAYEASQPSRCSLHVMDCHSCRSSMGIVLLLTSSRLRVRIDLSTVKSLSFGYRMHETAISRCSFSSNTPENESNNYLYRIERDLPRITASCCGRVTLWQIRNGDWEIALSSP